MGSTAVAERPVRHAVRRGPALRSLAYLVALLLPVAAATWAFSELAADRELVRVDGRLRATLSLALEEYGDVLDRAQARAERLATLPAVQRALAERDRKELAALERRHPRAQFSTTRSASAPGAARTAVVLSGGRRLGRVVVTVPIGAALLERLRGRVQLEATERLVLARSGPLPTSPAFVDVGGKEVRALAASLRRGPNSERLVIQHDRAAISAAAADIRRRVLVIGGVAVLVVAMLAYSFAPTLAGTRTRRRQRAQAERVLAQLSDGVFEIDEGGIVTFWNPAAARLTGLAAQQVVGRPADATIPGWPAVRPLVPVSHSPGSGESPVSATVPFEADGRELWLSFSAVDAAGGILYAFRDVTRERRLEEMRGELIATVSHELRTPLASVYGAAMTLQRASALDEASRAQLVELVGTQAQRLARIVDEILTASQLSTDTSDTPEQQVFDAAGLAEEAVADARARSAREIKLERPTWRVRATGETDSVRRVLDNLLDNAIKYSPERAPVAVRIDEAGDRIRMAVADEGLGIPSDEQGRVFEKFYRLDPAMSRGVGGTGLGLYIARGLAERMGGRLTLASQAGQGSTFTLELPRAKI